MGSHGANILVIVFAKVVYSVGGVFFEIRERLKKLCSVHRGQAFERCMGKWECLIAWTNACLLFAGDELVCGVHESDVTELLAGTRRSARPKSSMLTLLFGYTVVAGICSTQLCRPQSEKVHQRNAPVLRADLHGPVYRENP